MDSVDLSIMLSKRHKEELMIFVKIFLAAASIVILRLVFKFSWPASFLPALIFLASIYISKFSGR